MKNLFALLFSILSFSSYAQISKMGGIASRVNDSITYVTSTVVVQAHADGYHDIWLSNASNLWWVWDGSDYVNWDPTASGSGGSLNTLAPNIQAGDYTIQASDTAKVIYMRNASTPQTATIPSGLKVGSTFIIVQDTTATTTIACTGCDLIGTAVLTAKEVSVWHHRETGKYVRLGSSGGSVSDWGDIGGTLSDQTDLQAALDAKVNDTGAETIAGIKTFSSDPLIPDEAYGGGWDGSLEPPTKNAVYDKIQTVAATDYSRTAVAVSAGTLTLDMNSLALRNFDLTATQSSGFTIALANTTNWVEAKLTLRLTGSVAITMPSGVEMQNYETINARWNTSTNVLTLVGTTATRFLITFYYDGGAILTQASDSFE